MSRYETVIIINCKKLSYFFYNKSNVTIYKYKCMVQIKKVRHIGRCMQNTHIEYSSYRIPSGWLRILLACTKFHNEAM